MLLSSSLEGDQPHSPPHLSSAIQPPQPLSEGLGLARWLKTAGMAQLVLLPSPCIPEELGTAEVPWWYCLPQLWLGTSLGDWACSCLWRFPHYIISILSSPPLIPKFWFKSCRLVLTLDSFLYHPLLLSYKHEGNSVLEEDAIIVTHHNLWILYIPLSLSTHWDENLFEDRNSMLLIALWVFPAPSLESCIHLGLNTFLGCFR